MKKILLVFFIIGILTISNLSFFERVDGFFIVEKSNSNLILSIDPLKKSSDITDLQPGDILFHVSQYVVIHCLIYKQFNLTKNMYEFIEANSEHGVRRIFYSENRLNNTLIYRKFARVKTANTTQKLNAILFAESQIGKEFEWDMFFHDKCSKPNDSDNPFSNTWYCTELIWAAYYHCNFTPDKKIYGKGIDIDRNEWRKDSFIWSMVWPSDILWDDDVKVFYLSRNSVEYEYYFAYLSLSYFQLHKIP